VPAAAAAVYRALPAKLAGQIPKHGSRRVLEAIAAELVHRSPAELADRIARNWEHFRYLISDAEPIRDPIAVAIRLTRRGLDCPDVRCEDGHQLDLNAPCKACDDQGAALTAPQSTEDAPAFADNTPADPFPPVWRPLSDAEADSGPAAPAPDPSPPSTSLGTARSPALC
jgi:hypothetical protein